MTATVPPSSASAPSYRAWIGLIGELTAVVRRLQAQAESLDLASPVEMAWHGALFGKLAPQLEQDPFLIVAVTGGTNTGKSVVFNHLAGSPVSRSHPNATQTKHPVCSVPAGFLPGHDLAAIFPDFEIHPWTSEDDALAEGPDNRLIIRDDPSPEKNQPSRLLLLDTPDVDGVLRANWRRADLVRHASDVLVAILTQQKYNDAAVREFFKAAADADKTVLVVFNMVHWPRQQEHCRGWLETFCRETGAAPLHVYAAPLDFDAAEANRLPFYPLSPGATNPRADLAELQFDAIKIRSFRGSLGEVTDPQNGLAAYLRMLQTQSARYADARDLLNQVLADTRIEMPQLPRKLLWDEIFRWLESRRTRFDRAVHGGYSTVVGWVTSLFQREREPPIETFKTEEWDRMRLALAAVLDQLELHRRGGNEILRDLLGRVLGGMQRQQLFDDLQAAHAAMPVISDGYRQFIHQELDALERDNPILIRGITWGLVSTAVIRPVITFGLGPFGAHGIDVLAGHVLPLAGEFAAGAAGGEGLVAVSKWPLKAFLAKLFAGYYAERAELLGKLLQDRVAGDEVYRLGELAAAGHSSDLARASELLAELRAASDIPTR